MSPNFISRRDATDALCYAWISSRAVPSLFHVADASSDYHTRHHRLVIVPSFLPPISLLWSAFSTAVARASSHLLALAHALRNLLPKPRQVLPELLGSVDVGRGLVVGRREHTDDGQHDGLHRLHRAPPLVRLLVPQGVVARGVQDGDANLAVVVHVGVPHLAHEPHRRGIVGVVLGEHHVGPEEPALADGIRGGDDRDASVSGGGDESSLG